MKADPVISGKIVVVGSSNTDMVVRAERLPVPGETVLGGDFIMNPGGKGANQAVAARRLGGAVTFVARVGKDLFGHEAISGFRTHGINTDYIQMDDLVPSGVALIMVDGNGENCISVALGANAALTNSDIERAREVIREATFVLVQLEVPISVVEYVVEIAREEGTRVILNPAPAQELRDELLAHIHIITPNESEASLLTGLKVGKEQESVRSAAKALQIKGIDVVVITLGARGAYVLSDDVDELIHSPVVRAVDTTAAGDTFNGALAVGLAEGMTLIDAIGFANKAAAYSVTKMGAQASTPSRNDVELF